VESGAFGEDGLLDRWRWIDSVAITVLRLGIVAVGDCVVVVR
jgi:hypothetical protein